MILEEVQKTWICGFWRRIGALLIDSLVLSTLGYILGLFLEDTFVQLGAWGRFVGFVVSITYFGVMNSSLANGQTLGKRLLGIKVVDASNSTISLPKSLLRYSFIAVPFSLNGAQFSNEALFSYITYPLSLIIFGGLLSIAYLYIFNRVTRQSLHDLVVGTYVVNTDAESERLPSIWKPHLVVVIVLLILATLLPALTSDLAESEPFTGLVVAQKAISNNTSVRFASIFDGTSTFATSNAETSVTTFINVEAFLFENKIDDEAIAHQIAQTVIQTYPESLNRDMIQVTLTYGYDIGVASSWSSFNHQFDPEGLRELEAIE